MEPQKIIQIIWNKNNFFYVKFFGEYSYEYIDRFHKFLIEYGVFKNTDTVQHTIRSDLSMFNGTKFRDISFVKTFFDLLENKPVETVQVKSEHSPKEVQELDPLLELKKEIQRKIIKKNEYLGSSESDKKISPKESDKKISPKGTNVDGYAINVSPKESDKKVSPKGINIDSYAIKVSPKGSDKKIPPKEPAKDESDSIEINSDDILSDTADSSGSGDEESSENGSDSEESSGDNSESESESSSEDTPPIKKPILKAASKVTPKVTPKVVPKVVPKVIPKVAPKTTPKVIPKVAPKKSQKSVIRFESVKIDPLFGGMPAIERLIAAPDETKATGLRDRAMLELLYATGLRVSELCGLQLSAIQRDAGVLRVTGKGNKQRLVPVLPAIKAAIQAWLPHHPTGVPSDPLFTGARGARPALCAVRPPPTMVFTTVFTTRKS